MKPQLNLNRFWICKNSRRSRNWTTETTNRVPERWASWIVLAISVRPRHSFKRSWKSSNRALPSQSLEFMTNRILITSPNFSLKTVIWRLPGLFHILKIRKYSWTCKPSTIQTKSWNFSDPRISKLILPARVSRTPRICLLAVLTFPEVIWLTLIIVFNKKVHRMFSWCLFLTVIVRMTRIKLIPCRETMIFIITLSTISR